MPTKKRTSFVVYTDNQGYKTLSDEQLGKLIRAQMAHVEGEEPDLDPSEPSYWVYQTMVNNLDTQLEKYDKRCEQARRAAEKRWASQNQPEDDMPTDADACDRMPDDANACLPYPYPEPLPEPVPSEKESKVGFAQATKPTTSLDEDERAEKRPQRKSYVTSENSTREQLIDRAWEIAEGMCGDFYPAMCEEAEKWVTDRLEWFGWLDDNDESMDATLTYQGERMPRWESMWRGYLQGMLDKAGCV